MFGLTEILGMYYDSSKDTIIIVFDDGKGPRTHTMPADEFVGMLTLVGARAAESTLDTLRSARAAQN